MPNFQKDTTVPKGGDSIRKGIIAVDVKYAVNWQAYPNFKAVEGTKDALRSKKTQ